MNMRVPGPSPHGGLSALAPELAETFVTVASDIALVVDLDGTIRSVALGADASTPAAAGWVGRAWTDTVTRETRGKIQRLLEEVALSGVSRRCEVDHLLPSGVGVPMAYTAVRLGDAGPVLAAGRDLRAIAAIQQRFVQTQQEMERDYWKRREADARYRRLFHVATDAVLVLDAATLRVLEGNPAAAARMGLPVASLPGRSIDPVFDPVHRPLIGELLANARWGGQAAEIRAWLDGRSVAVDVSATPFRSADAAMLLVRMRAVDPVETGSSVLNDFVERTPDAVVVTDSAGRVLMGNPAFADLCAVDEPARLEGRLLGEWLESVDGAESGGIAAVLAEVQRHGIVQRAAARVRLPDGVVLTVEMAAALITDGDGDCIGFTLRRSLAADEPAPDAATLGARAETRALLARVGQDSLPDLMRLAAALAERQFIGRALALVQGDRLAAARLLGMEPATLERRLAATLPDAAAPGSTAEVPGR